MHPSLKDRRHIVRSLMDKLRSHFNASTADLGQDGVWNIARIGAICAGSSHGAMEERVGEMRDFIEGSEWSGEFEAFDVSQEVFSYGDI